MTFITRFVAAFLIIAAALSFVAASPGYAGPSSCKKDEFWFEEKGCCVHRGGPHSPHKPPPEKHCPPHDWSWSKERGCCVPHHPRPKPHHHPKCHKDWEWSPKDICCKKSRHHYAPRGDISDHHSCKKNEFWFEGKGCCVRRGGPEYNKPPKEKHCPHGWSWSKKHSCCVPHHPRPHPHPHPKCHNDWEWSPFDFCCKKKYHH